MGGYYIENLYGASEKNAKGRLKIQAVNFLEFKELLEKAEKEACQLNETLSKLHNFEFDIDFSVDDFNSKS